MASIVFRDVTIEFPMLNFEHRSIKKKVASAATGGLIVAEARRVPCVRALADVDLRIGGGDRVGLIGPNGAGKTTLLRAMAGVYEPTRGQVDVEGRVMSLLDIGLQPDMTGTENIRLRGLLQGLGRGARAEMADEIASFSELGDFLDRPVRTYSSGMAMRLAFALATHGAPEILLMDEWIMVGDAALDRKSVV